MLLPNSAFKFFELLVELLNSLHILAKEEIFFMPAKGKKSNFVNIKFRFFNSVNGFTQFTFQTIVQITSLKI